MPNFSLPDSVFEAAAAHFPTPFHLYDEKAIREKAFAGYQVNDALLGVAHEGCMVQHCLPAHRGEEITAEVFEAHADEIFDEAENRLHAQKAVLVKLMK